MSDDKSIKKPVRPSRLIDNKMNSGKEFDLLYKEAYKVIDSGITLITEGKKQQASQQLEHGLKLIDMALSMKIESFNVGTEESQLYAEMQSKMRNTRKEVTLHFLDSGSSNASSSAIKKPEDPPSYDEYFNYVDNESASAILPVSYPKLHPTDLQLQQDGALEDFMNKGRNQVVSPILSPQSGEMIFKIENGVQIFFVYSNGRVTSPSYPSFLAIFTLLDPIGSDAMTGSPGARGFLQVGEWIYPLVPAQSPVLHSFYGAYMFPDPNNSEPGTSVGILIPDTIDKDTKETLDQILIQMTSYQEQKVPEGIDAKEESEKLMQKSTSVIISEGAVTISQGVVWGAEKLSEMLSCGSDKLKDSLQPESQARHVDPKWQSTAKIARNVSGTAVKVSGFVLNQIGKATLAIGRKVAPSIQKHGTKMVGNLTGYSDRETSNQVEGAMEIASGAVKGASTIYISLENAATILATSVSDSTVKVISHKYGSEYGELTDNTLNAVGQTLMAGHNISSLGVKGIAKRTAKDTGRALIASYDKKSTKPPPYRETDNPPSYQESCNDTEDQNGAMDGIEEATEATEKCKSVKPKK